MNEESIDYGIKYQIVKIKDNLYFLIPIGLVEGYSTTKVFYNEHEYKMLTEAHDLAGDIVVDSVFNATSLKEMYEFDDIAFLKEYFFAEEKDKILIVSLKKGQMKKFKVDAHIFEENNVLESFEVIEGKPIVSLNEPAIEDILSTTDLEEMRSKILRYKKLVKNIKAREKKEGTTKITVKNGSIASIESKGKITLPTTESTLGVTKSTTKETDQSLLGSDISLLGLENYIKERVFGHDKEIRKLAKSILMNYTAENGEKNEPILLLGPTGTGKTETMHAVSSYLNIPLVEVNSVNLVPQGIKGMSLEDCLYSLIVSCNYSVEQAERGLLFFDEFDKLGRVSSDYKSPVTQIFLKFMEGGTFLIDKPTDDYTFNTQMLIKVFAGAFTDLFEEEKHIGFGSSSSSTEFKPQNISEKEYFGKELITRIPHILVFNELTREDKKRVLLYSKISEYIIKKQRYARQFNVELTADDSYVEAILDRLAAEQKSMRELNNLIVESLDEAEYEMLSNPNKYQKLILTRETVEDNHHFKIS